MKMRKRNKGLIVFFVLALILIGVVLVGGDNPESVQDTLHSRGANWDLYRTSDGKFKKIFYSGAINMPDENGVYQPFEDVVNVSWDSGNIVYNWYNKEIRLEPFVIYNNSKYTVQQIKQAYPNINLKNFINRNKGNYKWSLNLTNIPDSIKDNLNYIVFELVSAQNLTWSDVSKDSENVYLPDGVVIGYRDLIDSGFTLNLINKSYLAIGNVSGKNDLWIDPTASYNYSNETNIWAFEKLISDAPPPNTGPHPTTGESDITSSPDLDASDNNYEYLDIPIDQGYHLFQSNISQNKNDVTLINWTWEGSQAGGDGTTYFYMWNFTDSTWFQCTSTTTSDNDVIKSCFNTQDSYTFLINDTINNNGSNFFLVYQDSGGGDSIRTDFIKLEIEYYDLIINEPSSNDKTLNTKQDILNISVTGYNQSVWYTVNDGKTNYTICNLDDACAENQTTITYPKQGYFNLTVYANQTRGETSGTITNLFVGNKTTYDYNIETNIWAWHCDYTNDEPPPDSVIPSCNGNLVDITSDAKLDASDNNKYSNSGPGGNENVWQKLNASIQEDVSTIILLNWIWEGEVTLSGNRIYFNLYNFTSSSYVQFDTTTSRSDVVLNLTTSNTNNFISGNETILLVHYDGTGSSGTLATDFIKLEIIYYTPNTEPNTPTLTTPTNNSYQNYNNTVFFNWTATDPNSDNITYSLFADTNANPTTLIYTIINASGNDVWHNYTNTTGGFPDGIYYWKVDAQDSVSANISSEIQMYTIDTTLPTVTYGAGTEADETNFTRSNIYVKVSITETNFQNITFRYYNNTKTLENETTYTTQTFYINFTNLGDDIYYYNVTVIDKANNQKTTTTRTIRLDNLPPSVDVQHPKPQAYSTNNTFSLNYSAVDLIAGVKNCWYSLYNSSGYAFSNNLTLYGCSNATINQTGGYRDDIYKIILYSNDTLDQTGSDTQ